MPHHSSIPVFPFMKSLRNSPSSRRGIPAWIILALVAANVAVHRVSAATPEEACGKFVQQFYDAYLAKSKGTSNESAIETMVKKKPESFTPELLAALKEDIAAAHKSPGEIVGLSFDPVLNSQDPSERYVIGKVSTKKDHYYVEVFGVTGKKKPAQPDVTAELVNTKGKWAFSNFLYSGNPSPSDRDLLSVLKELKKERKK
jgi:hypothetical protein